MRCQLTFAAVAVADELDGYDDDKDAVVFIRQRWQWVTVMTNRDDRMKVIVMKMNDDAQR